MQLTIHATQTLVTIVKITRSGRVECKCKDLGEERVQGLVKVLGTFTAMLVDTGTA